MTQRRDRFDEDERSVLLNAVEEGLVSELQCECGGDARLVFERLWREGFVGLYRLGNDRPVTADEVAVALADTGLWGWWRFSGA